MKEMKEMEKTWKLARRRHEEGGSVSVTAAPERADGQLHSVVEVLFWSIIGDEEI